jgi:uncharacterized protein (TIGR00297 family)
VSPVILRTLIGFLVAAVIILFARRQNALTPSGAFLAVVFGTICAAAGWGWAVLLIVFFVSANLLSRYRRQLRAMRIDDFVEKGSTRDVWQVAANGAVFSGAALASLINASPAWLAAGAGAIAAVTSDTWSTEIGTVVNQSPRLITTGKVVSPGTSGGVTWAGSFAGLAGCALMAMVCLVAGWGRSVAAAAIGGGIAGSLADSLIGATIQRKQWCPHCKKVTEQLVHSCGTITEPHGGSRWIGNDAVNFIAAAVGAIAGIAVSR